ncbi:UDP-N-acetylmuramoyl-L-alanyl-D-glutamate--2,6-diaminopimelate ligase [Eubacteriales bacterium OttesenSCG-928-G02]|nr:UDP-N-acetylmuramoyl-L-alanyl-D-glutamate--2,6-diaminopimelate ligase [Eubacteriales bacterium OttesenSCG-928-G02]
MLLSKILDKTDIKIKSEYMNLEIDDLIYDTRALNTNNPLNNVLFVCITGFVFNGHTYVKEAYDKGVRVFAVESDVTLPSDAIILKCKNTRMFLATASSNFFMNPSKKLTTIAITGTKGKTNTSMMIKNILEAAGIKTGVIGTNGIFFGDKSYDTENSTPESYIIHKLFSEMIDDGCKAVVMETSSQGFKLFRTHGICFDIGVFTNLSPDHIGGNEHKDFNEYIQCKSMLFKQCKIGILNADDEHYKDMISGSFCDVVTFGMNKKYDIQALNPVFSSDENGLFTEYELKFKHEKHKLKIPLLGMVSVYNSLCASAVSVTLGIDFKNIENGLQTTTVKGRTELVPTNNNFTVVLDYAHNEASINSIFNTLAPYKTSRIITVFGCGGERAKQRRYSMGNVITQNSDYSIITSDNPRNENLDDIINDILLGIKTADNKYTVIKDRKKAIYAALDMAEKNDIVLIVGKGHQDYEEINGVKYPFNEREIVTDYLKAASK